MIRRLKHLAIYTSKYDVISAFLEAMNRWRTCNKKSQCEKEKQRASFIVNWQSELFAGHSKMPCVNIVRICWNEVISAYSFVFSKKKLLFVLVDERQSIHQCVHAVGHDTQLSYNNRRDPRFIHSNLLGWKLT